MAAAKVAEEAAAAKVAKAAAAAKVAEAAAAAKVAKAAAAAKVAKAAAAWRTHLHRVDIIDTRRVARLICREPHLRPFVIAVTSMAHRVAEEGNA